MCFINRAEEEPLIAPAPVNDRCDVVALKYSGLKTSQLKELLKQRTASLRGKKDLLER